MRGSPELLLQLWEQLERSSYSVESFERFLSLLHWYTAMAELCVDKLGPSPMLLLGELDTRFHLTINGIHEVA